MILLDGKKLSQKIIAELAKKVAAEKKEMRLAVVVVGENSVVNQFVAQKKKAAESAGIRVRVYPFDEAITTSQLRKRISDIVHEEKNTGVIVQLPLPKHINKQYILDAIPPQKDVDVLSSSALGKFAAGKSRILPPVAGAIKALFDEYGIEYRNKYAVIMGYGSLVGKPVALWLLNERVTLSVVGAQTKNPEAFLGKADIIISGIGKPKYITGDFIKEGAVIIDAGTSESEGKVLGDVDFDSVKTKASYVTPVPGGVGPLTVAILLQNLVTLGGLN